MLTFMDCFVSTTTYINSYVFATQHFIMPICTCMWMYTYMHTWLNATFIMWTHCCCFFSYMLLTTMFIVHLDFNLKQTMWHFIQHTNYTTTTLTCNVMTGYVCTERLLLHIKWHHHFLISIIWYVTIPHITSCVCT